MPTLFIDADACPVKREAIRIARAHGISVLLVGNSTQNFDKYTTRGEEKRPGVEAVTVPSGHDIADFEIISRLKPQDIVVTQDIGVAAMALGKDAYAISPRGRIFHKATIDADMELRHAQAKHRRAGGRHDGPRKFTDEDREHFEDSLTRTIALLRRNL